MIRIKLVSPSSSFYIAFAFPVHNAEAVGSLESFSLAVTQDHGITCQENSNMDTYPQPR